MSPGTYLLSFVKIASVTAEILLILSFCGGGVCRVIFFSTPTIVLRLGSGFDNIKGSFAVQRKSRNNGTPYLNPNLTKKHSVIVHVVESIHFPATKRPKCQIKIYIWYQNNMTEHKNKKRPICQINIFIWYQIRIQICFFR